MQCNTTVFANFNRQMARAVMLVVLLIGGGVNAYAQQGVLSFGGQVVNPTCEVDALHATRLIEQTLRAQVRPGLVVVVKRAVSLCQAQALLYSMHFQPLAEPVSQRVSESAGVLTLTYQ